MILTIGNEIFWKDSKISVEKLSLNSYAEVAETNIDGFIIDENGVLTRYTGTAETVVIPENVIEIGSWAFSNCKTMKYLKIQVM